MLDRLLSPFVEAACDVLEQEANVSVSRGSLSLKREAYVTDDVTVLINLVGDASGMAIFGMGTDTAKIIVSRMLGQEFDEFDALARSGIAELSNVVSGQATVGINQEVGIFTDISVPTLLLGSGSRVSTLGIDRLTIPLESEIGVIRVDLAVRLATKYQDVS